MKLMTWFFRSCNANIQLRCLKVINIMIEKKVIVGEPQSSDHMRGKLEVRRKVDTDCTWPSSHDGQRKTTTSCTLQAPGQTCAALKISAWASILASVSWGILMPGEWAPDAVTSDFIPICAEERAQFLPVIWLRTF